MQGMPQTDRTADRPPKPGRSGWIAFAVGMGAMFVLLAIWIVLVEMEGERRSDAFIALETPQAQAPAQSDRCREGTESGCRLRSSSA